MTAPALAEPQGGQVRAGDATIEQTLGTTNVTQRTGRAIVDWQRFNISPNELVRFVQPNRAAVILNRVTGADPSLLQGRMTANGQVFLVNPNGILFGPSSQVDVGSLVATTLSISDQDFLSGDYRVSQQGDLASVVNQGTIRVSDEGYVVLTAPLVSNEGLIVANLGRVELQAGTSGTLNLDGRHLVSYQLDHGTDEGTVVLTKDAVSDLLRQAMSSPYEAVEIREEGGQIRLVGAEGTLVQAGAIQGESLVLQSTRRSDISGSMQGSFVETSSHRQLDFSGSVQADDWLVDPANLTVVTTVTGPNEFAASTIEGALNSGTNFTLDAQGTPGSEPGNITVNAAINKTGGSDATLTMRAGTGTGNITINQAIGSSAGQLDLVLEAGGNVLLNNVSVHTNGGDFSSTARGAFNQSGLLQAGAGTVVIDHDSDIQLTSVSGNIIDATSQGFIIVASALATDSVVLDAVGAILDGDPVVVDGLDIVGQNVSLRANGISNPEVRSRKLPTNRLSCGSDPRIPG